MLRCLRPGVASFQTTNISAASRPVTPVMRWVCRMVTVTVVKRFTLRESSRVPAGMGVFAGTN